MHFQQRCDAIAFGKIFVRKTIRFHDSAVVRRVRMSQFRRHQRFVVKVGEAAV